MSEVFDIPREPKFSDDPADISVPVRFREGDESPRARPVARTLVLVKTDHESE